jgi:MarR family transcriptional regulator, organic hydroperoxide resistance regulator
MATQQGLLGAGPYQRSSLTAGQVEENSGRIDDSVRRFGWAVAAVSTRLEDLRHCWATTLGVSGPQWLILMAVDDRQGESGIPVKDVAAKLEVDPSFVTVQSKNLEKTGFLSRSTSREDSRVILLSLTALARKEIAKLKSRQSLLNEFICAGLSERELNDIIEKLASLSKRLEKASLCLDLESLGEPIIPFLPRAL